MQYAIGLLVGLLLVTGQALWKAGLSGSSFKVDAGWLFSTESLRFLFSPYILTGIAVYLVATLAYFYALSKYEYSVIQSIIVAASLIFTFAIAKAVFDEKVSLVNLTGLALLILGTFLVGKR